MLKNICYFVDDISTPFVMKDIHKMAERYENVYLFSVDALPEKSGLPPNVRVFEEFMDWKGFSWKKILFRNFSSVIGILLKECLAAGKWLPLRRSVALLCSNIFKAQEVMRLAGNMTGKQGTETLYYSFWFYDSVFLAWIRKHQPMARAVSRAHSGDLYEDHISIRDKVLFRHFQMKYLDGVFPVSEMGTDYLKHRYPEAAGKIDTLYLGTEDKGCLNPFDGEHFVLVSCASFRHHKRIHRIAESLLHVNMNLTWYHFGDENLHTSDPKIPEYIRLKVELQKKPNIRFIPAGQTENEKLFEFYRNTPVNLFISLSAVEGIPVSIMEAISFGIPVLSTDVGGCREIVNDSTGILIPLETGCVEVAEMITSFRGSEKNSETFRAGVRKFWEARFNEKNNYLKFFSVIEKMK